MKVVINSCYGGFGLSEKAMIRYAELKGITLYPENTDSLSTTYWKVSEADRVPSIPWPESSEAERKEFNESYAKNTMYEGDIPRDDEALVQVVEELGKQAHGYCAKLAVVEIPDDVQWEVTDYDGYESIEEVHRSWG